jgi:hypothetical protein
MSEDRVIAVGDARHLTQVLVVEGLIGVEIVIPQEGEMRDGETIDVEMTEGEMIGITEGVGVADMMNFQKGLTIIVTSATTHPLCPLLGMRDAKNMAEKGVTDLAAAA